MTNFEFLEKITKELKELEQNIDNIKRNREKEINEINKKYDNELQQNIIDKIKLEKQFNEVKKTLIEKYSTFNKLTIGQVLAELITIYNQKEYFSFITDMIYTIKPDLEVSLPTLLILPDPNMETFFNQLDTIQDNNTYIILTNLDKYNDLSIQNKENITIYRLKRIDGSVNTNIYYDQDSTKLPFIYEFINYVISYRIKNKIDDISLEELEKLKDEFVNTHQAEIKEYHKNNNLTLKREK